MSCCPSKNEEVQKKAAACYQEEENRRIANAAGKVEAEGYGMLCRMEEINVQVFIRSFALKLALPRESRLLLGRRK